MKSSNEKIKNEFKRRAYAFVLRLVKAIDALPKGMVSEVMAKQLVRSGTSILANYIEAQAASSKKDFINFFHHALKSANESKVWLALFRDTEKGDIKEWQQLLDEVTEIANILAKSIITMKNKS